MRIATVLLSFFTLFAASASAWNATGHKIISAMVYDRLSPAARARVDDLIRAHPDYQTHFLRDVPTDAKPEAKARAAFINCSIWPDQIRDDPRFYNEDRAGVQSPPLLAGFPDMGRHTKWHYIDLPFTQDGTPLGDIPVPNALTEIELLAVLIAQAPGGASHPAYALPWLVHLVEDLHNPLHTVQRFSRDNPNGDQGGNLIYVMPGRNLHAFWDSLGGPDPQPPAYVDQQAKKLARTGAKRPMPVGPSRWAVEGEQEAKKTIYTFGQSSGTQDHPIALSKQYEARAKQLYTEEFFAAAVRLVDILNTQFK